MDTDPAEQRRIRRLGSPSPACAVCGEADTRTLELHHVAGRAYDELVTPVCRNCHRKLSDPAANGKLPVDLPVMERVGHLMLGLAALLALLVERLRRFGTELIAGASVSPWPYGWVGAPEAE